FAFFIGLIGEFLEFFLKGFLEKLTSFVEVELFEVVEGLPVGGVFGDEVAFVEQGIESFVEQGADFSRGAGRGGEWALKYVLVKKPFTAV
ncbi:MAG: hypothetical protein LBI05_04635, partial [Planctomycetaceae bacterium]|nr:hypothetical protein [Planctomycetaceae bacterium]